MKKISKIAVPVLLALLVLGLCACGGTKKKNGIEAGRYIAEYVMYTGDDTKYDMEDENSIIGISINDDLTSGYYVEGNIGYACAYDLKAMTVTINEGDYEGKVFDLSVEDDYLVLSSEYLKAYTKQGTLRFITYEYYSAATETTEDKTATLEAMFPENQYITDDMVASFTIDGVAYDAAFYAGQLTENGWTLSKDSADTAISENGYTELTYQKDGKNLTVYVCTEDAALHEPTDPEVRVVGISCNMDEDPDTASMTTSAGITLGSPLTDALAVYGMPDTYDSDRIVYSFEDLSPMMLLEIHFDEDYNITYLGYITREMMESLYR